MELMYQIVFAYCKLVCHVANFFWQNVCNMSGMYETWPAHCKHGTHVSNIICILQSCLSCCKHFLAKCFQHVRYVWNMAHILQTCLSWHKHAFGKHVWNTSSLDTMFDAYQTLDIGYVPTWSFMIVTSLSCSMHVWHETTSDWHIAMLWAWR
jgi:hypothetical protein